MLDHLKSGRRARDLNLERAEAHSEAGNVSNITERTNRNQQSASLSEGTFRGAVLVFFGLGKWAS